MCRTGAPSPSMRMRSIVALLPSPRHPRLISTTPGSIALKVVKLILTRSGSLPGLPLIPLLRAITLRARVQENPAFVRTMRERGWQPVPLRIERSAGRESPPEGPTARTAIVSAAQGARDRGACAPSSSQRRCRADYRSRAAPRRAPPMLIEVAVVAFTRTIGLAGCADA